MAVSKLDLLKFFSDFDGEVTEGDFSPEELRQNLGVKQTKTQKQISDEYFAFYDDVKDRTRGHEDW